MFFVINKLKKLFCSLTGRAFGKYNTPAHTITEKVYSPKVSVIVPVYNAENYVERCMHYLLMQTLKEIEIIVINDGSTDNSMLPVKKLAELDSRIKIIEQENHLQGHARNRGIEIAQGEYIGFCDADDYVDYAYYEELYNAAKRNDADIALAENVRVSKTKYKRRLHIESEECFSDILGKLNVCNQHKNECPTNKIYRKNLLTDNNIFFAEGVYCEDKLFSLKAVYYANKIVTVPFVHYFYWENPNSTVNAIKTKKHIEDKKNARKSVLEFAKEKQIPVENWYFKAEKERIKFCGITLFVIMESTKSEKGYLFGLIPVFEKNTEACCD